jgi:hypothetical protein
MNREFNRAANDSPRSGSSEQVTPMMWGAIVLTFVVVAIWLRDEVVKRPLANIVIVAPLPILASVIVRDWPQRLISIDALV